MTYSEIESKTAEILVMIQPDKMLNICTKDGEISINGNTKDFTYIGNLGSKVCCLIAKKQSQSLLPKLFHLSGILLAYSKNIGGVSYSYSDIK